jgi:hypothetical protein
MLQTFEYSLDKTWYHARLPFPPFLRRRTPGRFWPRGSRGRFYIFPTFFLLYLTN